MRQSLPRWVVIVVALHAFAALTFGTIAHLDPSVQFPDLTANDDGLFATGLYANRNIGVGLALLTALALRSRWMLAGLMLARFSTDVADLIMAVTQAEGGAGLAGRAVFFAVLFASEIAVIRALLRLEGAPDTTDDRAVAR